MLRLNAVTSAVAAERGAGPTAPRGAINPSFRLAAPAPDDVHLWWIDLPGAREDGDVVLSPEELARADRFHRPRDRRRWVAARVALRRILAGYVGVAPEEVRFGEEGEASSAVGPHPNKPALADPSSLRFNLTHAGDRAALAVAWNREVGIDLEALDPGIDLPPLLTVACTPAERDRIEALPASARVAAFLTLWTLKEAYLKAIGSGLFQDPRTLEADVLPDGHALIHDALSETNPQWWSSSRLDAGPGWIAALTVAGASPTIISSVWPIADSR